jgi:imidazolonepropionase-like amidohydrolase
VRQVIASGADWVKMHGSTGGFDDVTQFQTFTFEEMKAAVDATHALGKKIAIHSYGPAGARAAVRAGTDSLEHGADIDDETIAEMAKRRTYYVPTIDHNQYYVENADTVYRYPAGAKERLRDYIQRNVESARKAFRAGVRIVMGSDAVYNGWGLNARELDWFVKIGMTPEQALKTATTEAAAIAALRASPSITACWGWPSSGSSKPSTRHRHSGTATRARQSRSAARFVTCRPRSSIPCAQRDVTATRTAACSTSG